jgi:hypothetical protein
MAALKKNILDSLIEREILYQQSQKVGIQVTDQKVDDHWRALKSDSPMKPNIKMP